MSKYLLDKFVYQVDRDPDALAGYLEDPAAYVARWEREEAGKVTSVEFASGQQFTDGERAALVTTDIEALYVMGVHPFLLFTWLVPILQERVGEFPAILEHYNAAIAGHGRPSWRT